MYNAVNGIAEDFERILRPIDPETGKQLPAFDFGISIDTQTAFLLGLTILGAGVATNVISAKLLK